LILIPLVALPTPTTAAGAVEAPLRIAGQLYAQGNYAQAAESYRQLVDQGYAAPALFYNLGLTYLKADDLGRALWSLRSAEQLAPRDEDIRAALVEARTTLAAKAPAGDPALRAPEPMGLGQLIQEVRRWVTADELAILALGLWAGLAILLLVGMTAAGGRARRAVRGTSAVVGVGLAVALLVLTGPTWVDGGTVSAVVVGDNVELRVGPGAGFGAAATAPWGADVRVAEVRGDWVQVTLADGGRGWALARQVAVVAVQDKPILQTAVANLRHLSDAAGG
jgi:hypothetical protein